MSKRECEKLFRMLGVAVVQYQEGLDAQVARLRERIQDLEKQLEKGKHR